MENTGKNGPSSGNELGQGLAYLTKNGVAAQGMVVLTGGAFLIAFAIELGASNLEIGLLAAAGPLAQLLQVPAVYAVETFRKRKAIALSMLWLNRLCWLGVALVPFLVSGQAALRSMLLLVFASSAAGAVATCGWNSWIRDLVPDNIMGAYFGRRMRLGIGAGIFLSLGAAAYLDFTKGFFGERVVYAYSVLFILGAAAGMLSLFYLGKVPDVPMEAPAGDGRFIRALFEPLKDSNFRNLTGFLCSWSFAANLAAPFFMVYMLRRLGLDMSVVIALSLLSQAANYAFLGVWGGFADRFSNKSVMSVCGPLMIVSFIGWTFTTMPGKHFLTLPLLAFLHFVIGMASAGMALASSNIALKMAPRGKSTSYLAANTVLVSVAAGIGPILGGKFADYFHARELSWTLEYTSPHSSYALPTLSLQQWDFFFVFAFLLGLYSLARLRKVNEVGEVHRKVVAENLLVEVRRQVRTLSSAEGIRQMITFPFGFIRELREAGVSPAIERVREENGDG